MAEEVEFMRNRQGAVRMKVLKYEGIIWPPMIKDPVKTVEEHKKFPYQDGDLFVCSYPRTGRRKVRGEIKNLIYEIKVKVCGSLHSAFYTRRLV